MVIFHSHMLVYQRVAPPSTGEKSDLQSNMLASLICDPDTLHMATATLQTYCQPPLNIPEHYQKILKFLASKNLQNIQQETRFHPWSRTWKITKQKAGDLGDVTGWG